MYALPLIASMAACLLNGMIRKYLNDQYDDSLPARQLYNAVTCLVAAICLLLVGGIPQASPFTIFLALAFGLVTAVQQITTLQALTYGPYSYTSVICSLSTIIPALSGALLWGEPLGLSHVIGLLLMVVCFILSVDFSSEQKKTSLRWLIYCLVAFLCQGAIGVMQKWHQSTDYRGELDAFLIIAFAFSFLYSVAAYAAGVIAARSKGQGKAQEGARPSLLSWLPLLLMAVVGICVAVNNKLNLFLSGVMDSAVFFPLVNGGGLVLTALAAVLLFRERLSHKQWVGVLVGIVAVIFLCNPFGG